MKRLIGIAICFTMAFAASTACAASSTSARDRHPNRHHRNHDEVSVEFSWNDGLVVKLGLDDRQRHEIDRFRARRHSQTQFIRHMRKILTRAQFERWENEHRGHRNPGRHNDHNHRNNDRHDRKDHGQNHGRNHGGDRGHGRR